MEAQGGLLLVLEIVAAMQPVGVTWVCALVGEITPQTTGRRPQAGEMAASGVALPAAAMLLVERRDVPTLWAVRCDGRNLRDCTRSA